MNNIAFIIYLLYRQRDDV